MEETHSGPSNAARKARIAVLGDRDAGYVTHRELDAALALFPDWVDARWIATDSAGARALEERDGLWVAPGSPYRDNDAVLAAIAYARENEIPMLATCSGFQYAVVEFARNVAGLHAAHAEIEPEAEMPVVTPLRCSLVGETRSVSCVSGTRIGEICGLAPFEGFHWCSFGLADSFIEPLSAAGLTIGAHAEDAGVEAVELSSHTFFIGTLFQPQVGASDGRALHPLIRAFLVAAGERAGAGALARPML